ncbi:PREDICTED: uncharacterized protein LOC104610838 isoform X2 [Nelumbo nucifera]|uniref:Uncharacterized protein LOC104610838 isoform X2 n=2 Tax=Nelumbo nucifera TaxID=4432 RepID=A0A1U8B4V8_NELNU|nr:PREDICTED: uncharacterized protein LOC104610838 isoform X2 [Nelumbo nucifera]DAD33945.1 TPA_asm: hypothetical protein HUJ06_012796 [Nelumbo nucifera]
MLSYSAILPRLPQPIFLSSSSRKQHLFLNNHLSFRKPNSASFICLSVGIEQLAEITQNKVLVAAGVSCAIGQLSKPFTSALLYGNDIDFKTAVLPGGFPSTHSAGVRREVGNHAKVLNRRLLRTQDNTVPNRDKVKDDKIDSKTGRPPINSETITSLLSLEETGRLYSSNQKEASSLTITESRMSRSSAMRSSSLTVDGEEELSDNSCKSNALLKEAVGHTEVEVIAGALLGLLVSFALYSVA